ncbi:hypothetical protein VCRA2116O30_290019 [Vibrio crassostreae]|nr:hypothetical protein VCHA38P215_10472 [Vibrio chagasii]CAK1986499.1 hypothetical protein VCRA2116O30_290019 [Vibrio crassostreae]CAH7100398.1 hypothetical protein VCHA48P434_10478 [Vibrio chagasii]CAK2031884.1 hypothetical protein VCRA2113O20_300022 [Vibrio crassostreae]CAK2045672.1 hypothetical protein VCRA2117O39_350008 [Vibrio crassostreae]
MVNQFSQLWLSLLSALVDKANYFQLQNTSLALAMSRDDILTQSWTEMSFEYPSISKSRITTSMATHLTQCALQTKPHNLDFIVATYCC